MDLKDKISGNPQKFLRFIGICISVLLIVFEIIIGVTFISIKPMPDAWKIASLIVSMVVLDVLCLVEVYCIKTLHARIVLYAFDFLCLLFICAITGSAYLSALYVVILSQLYLNVEDIKTKAIVFVSSCVSFVAMCIVGWLLNHMRVAISDDEILQIISGCITGLIVLAIHFAVANFLIGFYRTNIKLTAALKEADENKAQLKEVYEQLSETAVFQERNRIARDIHDNAGHSMTAVIMQTEAAKLLIDSDPEAAKAKVISANIQAKNALEQMRESVHLLAGRNSSHSLKEELEEIIAQTMDGTEVKIRYDIEDADLGWEKKRFIANSLKECLSNGMRHGGATAFYVEFSIKENMAVLTVSDNGSGLPENFKEGFGIRGMREKATAFGGSIVFESESGDGCEINIAISFDGEEKTDD